MRHQRRQWINSDYRLMCSAGGKRAGEEVGGGVSGPDGQRPGSVQQDFWIWKHLLQLMIQIFRADYPRSRGLPFRCQLRDWQPGVLITLRQIPATWWLIWKICLVLAASGSAHQDGVCWLAPVRSLLISRMWLQDCHTSCQGKYGGCQRQYAEIYPKEGWEGEVATVDKSWPRNTQAGKGATWEHKLGQRDKSKLESLSDSAGVTVGTNRGTMELIVRNPWNKQHNGAMGHSVDSPLTGRRRQAITGPSLDTGLSKRACSVIWCSAYKWESPPSPLLNVWEVVKAISLSTRVRNAQYGDRGFNWLQPY